MLIGYVNFCCHKLQLFTEQVAQFWTIISKKLLVGVPEISYNWTPLACQYNLQHKLISCLWSPQICRSRWCAISQIKPQYKNCPKLKPFKSKDLCLKKVHISWVLAVSAIIATHAHHFRKTRHTNTYFSPLLATFEES